MGYTAMIMLPAVAVVCGYILLNHQSFSHTVVISAGTALFVDVLGLIAAVWKVVLKPGSITKLEPTIAQGSINVEGPALETDTKAQA